MAGLLSDNDVDSGAAQALRVVSSGAIIIAHKEDTAPLRIAFEAEGVSVDEVRGPYTDEQLKFSAIMRCFVNHANAWRIAAKRDRPTIIVEADFVPVKGFGDLPAPVPAAKFSNSLVYLYSTGPQIWDLATANVARGHGGGAVALLIPPKVAMLLLQFFDEQLDANPLGKYSPWDSDMGYWLMKRGIESYIPYRQYGEHGGLGMPEHAKFGLPRVPRADVLQGSLAFMPIYAKGSALRYWKTRMWARIWGVLRLLYGRSLAWHDFARSDRLQMLRFALGRLFLPSPPGTHMKPD
jgi:hypothetical protein